MTLQSTWRRISEKKQSWLCVGLDPTEAGQHEPSDLKPNQDKIEWAITHIRSVAPYASAIKPNRNYFKDVSRTEMQKLVREIHAQNMLAIDDCKLTDIGDTVDSGLYHAAQEGFDAVTFAPFAGNTAQAAASAQKRKISLIVLVLMSNPEFQSFKNARFGTQSGYEFFATEAAKHESVGGVVVGAPNANNQISESEITKIKTLIGDRLVLMPGIGHQGGELASMLKVFGKNLVINVGRGVFRAKNPAEAARQICQQIQF